MNDPPSDKIIQPIKWSLSRFGSRLFKTEYVHWLSGLSISAVTHFSVMWQMCLLFRFRLQSSRRVVWMLGNQLDKLCGENLYNWPLRAALRTYPPLQRVFPKDRGPVGVMADGERSPLLSEQYDGTNGYSPGGESLRCPSKPQSKSALHTTDVFIYFWSAAKTSLACISAPQRQLVTINTDVSLASSSLTLAVNNV